MSFPPTEYMRLVSGEQDNLREHFDDVGRRFAGRLESVEMLEPEARLLDIGCGCGRIARHLLDCPIAAYAGFDRHLGMIEWARSHIGGLDDRFEFEHVDVKSGYAELDSNVGTISAARFDFPYVDGAFTGALSASVFTHMDFAGTSRYLSETQRVLAPGGRLLASFFCGETTGSMEGSGWNFTIREHDLRRAIELARLDVLLIGLAERSNQHSWCLLRKPEP